MIISFPRFQIHTPKFGSCTDHITATTHWKSFVTWKFETVLFLSCDLARCWKTLDKIMWPLSLSIYIRLIELSLRSTNCLFSPQREFFLPRPLLYFLCFILNSLRPRLSRKLVSPSLLLVGPKPNIVLTSPDKRIVILWNFPLLILHTLRNFYKQIKLKMLFKLPKSYLMLSSHFSLHKLQEEGQRKVDGGL